MYLVGLSYRGNTIEYIHGYKRKFFSKNESYLDENPFYKKLQNQSYETCAAIFDSTSNAFLSSSKIDYRNSIDSPMENPMDIPWSLDQQENALLFKVEILNILQGSQLQGNSGNFPDQQRFYFEIAQMKFIKTVCETGFNAGMVDFSTSFEK